MTSFILAGGMGAVLNCALASYFSSTLDYVLQLDMLVLLQPYSTLQTLKTIVPVLFGFFGGTLLLLTWHFLKTRVVRFLLAYDGWFLNPKQPIVKLWYLLIIAFMGREIRSCGKYQDYLPSLPVPQLKDTCRKYLDSVRPLLTKEEYTQTEQAVQQFQKKDGPKLHLILKLRSYWMRNWMAKWWLDFIYLRQRTPIPLNSNYYALGRSTLPSSHWLDRMAMMLYSSVTFAKLLREGKIETPRHGVVPFCTDGYKDLHMATRVPGEDIDKLVNYEKDKPRHVVVGRKGKFFKIEVKSKNGRVLPPKGIRDQLEKVVKMAGDEQDTTGVAAFTALPRAKWAQIRKRMEKSAGNRQSLYAIDSSFVICFLDDDHVPIDDLIQRARSIFHGNTYNRWWDKCVQLIISESAVSGANVEHSILDATVSTQLWEYILTDEEYDENGHVLDPFHGQEVFDVAEPTQLRWELDGFQNDLTEAKESLTTLINDSDLVLGKSYGKAIPKKCQLSPDGWFQMAMQLAYYRMYKKVVLTYESATTRLYYLGRTETIRPVSDASVEFIKAIDDPSVSKEGVKKELRNAIEYQCQYKFEAMRGLGVDRHLFGLYIVAKGMKLDPMPKMFQDKAFNFSFLLSTSQTPMRTTNRWTLEQSPIGGGFGAVTDEGYGVSYVVVGEDKVHWSVHSKRSCSTTDSSRYHEEIQRAMTDMRNLFGV